MPPVDQYMGVPPERVWAILADPPTYANWSVGARSIERADPDWPAPGTRFDHTQGQWPVVVRDYTESVAAEEPRHLAIIGRARPLLDAKVMFDIRPEPGGCRVWMEELPVGGMLGPVMRLPPWPQLIALRNKESLRRMRRLAEGA